MYIYIKQPQAAIYPFIFYNNNNNKFILYVVA